MVASYPIVTNPAPDRRATERGASTAGRNVAGRFALPDNVPYAGGGGGAAAGLDTGWRLSLPLPHGGLGLAPNLWLSVHDPSVSIHAASLHLHPPRDNPGAAAIARQVAYSLPGEIGRCLGANPRWVVPPAGRAPARCLLPRCVSATTLHRPISEKPGPPTYKPPK